MIQSVVLGRGRATESRTWASTSAGPASRFLLQGAEFRVQGSGFRVQGAGSQIQGSRALLLLLAPGWRVSYVGVDLSPVASAGLQGLLQTKDAHHHRILR